MKKAMKTDWKKLVSECRNEEERKGLDKFIKQMLTLRQMRRLRESHEKEMDKLARNSI